MPYESVAGSVKSGLKPLSSFKIAATSAGLTPGAWHIVPACTISAS